MNEAELGELRNQLLRKLAAWGLRGDLDEIVNETLSRYWESSRSKRIDQPMRWMLRTAKNVRSEIQRSCGNAIHKFESVRSSYDKSEFPQIDLSRCHAWTELSSEQQYVIRETIMFDRPVATVAREAGVKRSTAKSWKKRLPPRLAGDPFIAQYLNAVKSSHLFKLNAYASVN